MGFFKNIGKALGKVGKAVGSTVAKAANVVVSNIPVVGSIYQAATNIIGKDLGDLGTVIQNIGNKNETSATDSAHAQMIHDALQLESGKATGFAVYDQDNKLVSYNGTPVIDGMYYTATNTEASYDSNPLVLPSVLQSGATNQAMVNALEQNGINPGAVQEALTGVAPKGNNVDLTPLLDYISSANGQLAMATPGATMPAGQAEGSNNKILLIGAAVLGILGLGYFLTKK